jgi:hypothetical protein
VDDDRGSLGSTAEIDRTSFRDSGDIDNGTGCVGSPGDRVGILGNDESGGVGGREDCSDRDDIVFSTRRLCAQTDELSGC